MSQIFGILSQTIESHCMADNWVHLLKILDGMNVISHSQVWHQNCIVKVEVQSAKGQSWED